MIVLGGSREVLCMFRTGLCFVLVLSATVILAAQTHQPPLDRARELYYGAAYEEALAVLDGIDVASPTDAPTVELYRAACLFALGRTSEAEQTFERLVALSPDTGPEQLDMTPWIASRFAAVRARVLSRVDQRPTDNRVASATVAAPEQPAFYTVADLSVIRPVPLREDVPEPPKRRGVDFTGTVTLQVDIALDGSVEGVSLEGVAHPSYAELLRETARNWRYQPATLNSQPVKFRKALRIDIR
jgi:tetratricopeptide (TPR) repeat protein